MNNLYNNNTKQGTTKELITIRTIRTILLTSQNIANKTILHALIATSANTMDDTDNTRAYNIYSSVHTMAEKENVSAMNLEYSI